ncbi:MAG: glycosyltransferase family 2 protein [Oscillospiraceae bacterium]|jgi:glycosyltransferase involved in cell wall biosynthesis|nr:glycosyltransferase family 2 protein [Oscillospiraceae bacterium]
MKEAKMAEQGKVSMVVPCYNKVKWIGAMLDSVIAQEWDNIELILVNDGSTDGTREVIAEYEPRLRARGYEVVIIDQENGGCCKAVHTGLLCMTGEYMCIIDADDELDPRYVSTMAGWLESNAEYDYCICDYLQITLGKDGKLNKPHYRFRGPEDSYTPEFFLCNDLNKAAWAFLTRMSYIRKCRLIDTFYFETRGSYEPSFFIPLSIYGGKMKHFRIPLYYYNSYAEGMAHNRTFERLSYYWSEYHRVVLIMLGRMDKTVLDKYKRRYFANLSVFYTLKIHMRGSVSLVGGQSKTEYLRRSYMYTVNNWFNVDISYEDICEKTDCVCRAVELALTGTRQQFADLPPGGKIIAYGALGKSAANLLPLLDGTALSPAELWDKAGDGAAVRKPDFAALTARDTVLVLPASAAVVAEVSDALADSPARVLYKPEVDDYLAQLLFPQLADAELC